MQTIIQSNGSGYVLPLDALFSRLETDTLDPRFEDYGNFIFINPQAAVDAGYGPDGKTIYRETGPCYPDMPDAVEFWGNFLTYSHVFRIATDDPELISKLTKAIRANQSRPDYINSRKAAA